MVADGVVEAGQGRIVRGGGLRALLLLSLVLHVLLLHLLSGPADRTGPSPRVLDFELLAPPPVAVAEPRMASPELLPDAPDEVPAEPAPEARPPAEQDPARSVTAPSVVRPDVPGALDLTLPESAVAAPAPPGPVTDVFDPRLDARIRAARAAPRPSGAPVGAAPRVWAAAGEGRTRIETERGCYERVNDPGDGQAGEQWWFVACRPTGEEIDWGARFRARE